MKNKDRDRACAKSGKEGAGVREQRTVNVKMRVTSCPVALCDKGIMEIEMLHAGLNQRRMLQQFSNGSHNTARLINDARPQL